MMDTRVKVVFSNFAETSQQTWKGQCFNPCPKDGSGISAVMTYEAFALVHAEDLLDWFMLSSQLVVGRNGEAPF
jgi:hypothetical protein